MDTYNVTVQKMELSEQDIEVTAPTLADAERKVRKIVENEELNQAKFEYFRNKYNIIDSFEV